MADGKKMERIRNPKTIARLLFKARHCSKTGCWLWEGYKTKPGYGQIKHQGQAQWVHRMSYAIFNGIIPANLTVNHKCSTTNCINPDHLELVTVSENSKERHARHNSKKRTSGSTRSPLSTAAKRDKARQSQRSSSEVRRTMYHFVRKADGTGNLLA